MRYFDLHCDTLFEIAHRGGNLSERCGHIDLKRAGAYSPYVQVFALYCGNTPLDKPEKAHILFRNLIQTAQEQFEKNKDLIVHCTTFDELEETIKRGKNVAFLSVEGAELLQNDEDFQEAVNHGVKFINLSWNHDSVFACGALSDNEKGLTSRGFNFVSKMEKNRIIPDVSHLSQRGFWDLAEFTDMPFVATHSNSAHVCPHKRNLTDEQFCEIIRRRGLVGLNFYTPFVKKGLKVSAVDIFPHIDRFMELGGEDALSIGADFDGCDMLPKEIKDISDIQKLAELMQIHGYSSDLIDNIFFGNAWRFAENNF